MRNKKLYKKGGKKRSIKKKSIKRNRFRYQEGGMYENQLPSSYMPVASTVYEESDPQQLEAYEQQIQNQTAQAQNFAAKTTQRQREQDMQQQQFLTSITQPLKGSDFVKNIADKSKNLFSNVTGSTAGSTGNFLGTGKAFGQTGVGSQLTGALKNPMLYTMGAQLLGQHLSKKADDFDPTTFTKAEQRGRGISMAGQYASMGSMLGPIGTIVGGIGGYIHGVSSGKKQARIAKRQQQAQVAQRNTAKQSLAMAQAAAKEYSGYDLGAGYARDGGRRLYDSGGYRNFYMGGGPLNYAGGVENNSYMGQPMAPQMVPQGMPMQQPMPMGQPPVAYLNGGMRNLYSNGGRYKDTIGQQFFDEEGNYTGGQEIQDWEGTAGFNAPGYNQANPFGIEVPTYDMSIYEGYDNPNRTMDPTSGSLDYIEGESREDRARRIQIHNQNREAYRNYSKQAMDARKFHSKQDFKQTVQQGIEDTQETWKSMEGDPLAKVEYILDKADYVPGLSTVSGVAGGAIDIGQGIYYHATGDHEKGNKELIEGGTGLLFSTLGPGGKAMKTMTAPITNTLKQGLTEGIENKLAKTVTNKLVDQTAKNLTTNPLKTIVKDEAKDTLLPESKSLYAEARYGGKRLPGGTMKNIPGSDAVEFQGQSHEEGGILLDDKTEVEGGETMDKVKGTDYFFSSHLKLGGKSFAARHKQILAAGGKQKDIDELASIQERVAGREQYNLGGERKMFKKGGQKNRITYESGGKYLKWNDDPRWFYQDADGNVIAFDSEEAYLKHAEMTGDTMFDTGNQTYSSMLQLGNQESSKFISAQPISIEDIQEIADPETETELLGSPDESDNLEEEDQKIPAPGTEARKEYYDSQNWAYDDTIKGYNEGDSDPGPEWSGLYNNLNMNEVSPYLNEIKTLTGIEDFDFKNPDHVKKLQTTLLDFDAYEGEDGYITGEEGDFINPEGERSVNKAGVDGKFGTDTFEALKLKLDALDEEDKEDDTTDTPPEDEACPCKDGSWRPDCCSGQPDTDDEEEETTTTEEECPEGHVKDDQGNCVPVEEKLEDDSNEADKDPKKGKPFPWLDVATAGVGLAQLLPAYMAYKDKPDYMSVPGRMPTTQLDRVRYNDARAALAADNRAMNRFIEQSGMGPGAISARMASWGKKNAEQGKIEAQESRQNAAIQANEAQLNQQAAKINIDNAMTVDKFNRAADAKTKDRKIEAVQSGVQSLAGMIGDIRNYKRVKDQSTAIAGPTGVLDRFQKEEQYRKRFNIDPWDNGGQYTPEYLEWESSTFGTTTASNDTDNETSEENDEQRYGGRRRFKTGGMFSNDAFNTGRNLIKGLREKGREWNKRRLIKKRDRITDERRQVKADRLANRAQRALDKGNKDKHTKLTRKAEFFKPFENQFDAQYRDAKQEKENWMKDIKAKHNQYMETLIKRRPIGELQRAGESYWDYQKRIGNKVENPRDKMNKKEKAAFDRERMLAKQRYFKQNYKPTVARTGGYFRRGGKLKKMC